MGKHDLTADIEPLSDVDDGAILRLVGEIDMMTIEVLREAFQGLVNRTLSNVVIDAREVTFLDSTGLHAFVEGKRLIHEQGSTIVMVPSRIVRRVLDLVFPDGLFATRVETIDEATAAVKSGDDR
jgi:anti-sigma B factor antagonist